MYMISDGTIDLVLSKFGDEWFTQHNLRPDIIRYLFAVCVHLVTSC